MKLKIIILSLLLLLVTSLVTIKNPTVIASESYVVETDGCKTGSLPETLYLNRCSEEEVRAYYSSLNSIDQSKRSGTQVLAYLKDILYEMNYYTYQQVSDIYAITDRDWVHSPSLTSGTYDVNTNIVTSFKTTEEADSNPYIIMLYVDYSVEETTSLLKENGNANFDKEHVWCQSRGFKASSGAKGPAGTDLHHLIAGDSYVNQSIHNNNPYGFVSVDDSTKKGNRDATKNNLKGTQKNTSTSDESTTVFEPMDEWKGDIARAIFYMMARYNNISGEDTITEFEPNLSIVSYATSNGSAITSSATEVATIGNLSDLLAWNKLDPVSDYEIYRNDLIYRNYQGNRNPFIDYPEWIDAIWGTVDSDGTNYSDTPVGYLDPLNDPLYGNEEISLKLSASSLTLNVGETSTIKATISSANNIEWTLSDTSVISISSLTSASEEALTINALKEGKVSLTAKIKVDEKEYTETIWITVNSNEPLPQEEEFVIPIEIIIIISIVVIIIFIVIYVTATKKQRKQMKKAFKKAIKHDKKSKQRKD